MNEIISCGGVVIKDNKVLLLYKQGKKGYSGWVLPKGQLEKTETKTQAAIREVKEETNIDAKIIKYIDCTSYCFTIENNVYNKSVNWYLMKPISFDPIPQLAEDFSKAEYVEFDRALNLLHFELDIKILKLAIAQL